MVAALPLNHFTGRRAMTAQQVWDFCELNQHFECKDSTDTKHLTFRNNRLDWYKNDENRRTWITYAKIDSMKDAEELVKEINRGLEVDCITRITGYFSKKSQWNPGKLAELKDRRKHEVTESGCNSACPVAQGG
jgi:hypothetical protein